MKELEEFCNQYLPRYFASKYREANLKEPHFNFKSDVNVFELTARIFTLVDQLKSANPSLQPTKIILKNFMFEFSDFALACKDLRSDQNEARQQIRQILKKMNKLIRQSFQIFLRLIYLYFDSKQTLSNVQKDQIRTQYTELIPSLYTDLKFKAMTDDDDSFVPMDFMQYIIRLLLDMKPTQKFNKIIKKLIKQCDFSESAQQNIQDHIKNIKSIHILKNPHQSHQNKSPFLQDQQIKIIPSQQNNSGKNSSEKSQINESTPLKQKSASKMQEKTLETSQKKSNIIQNYYQDSFALESLRKTLKLHKKTTKPFRERTMYMRNKYLIPKKTQFLLDQNSSTGSNNNQNDELFLVDINSRNFSSRYLEVNDYDEGDFLAGATPKPKKKIKLDAIPSFTSLDDKTSSVSGF